MRRRQVDAPLWVLVQGLLDGTPMAHRGSHLTDASRAAHARPAYHHEGGVTPLIGATIDAFLRQVAATHAENEALVSAAQSRRLTYAQLDAQVDLVAKGLLSLDVEPGDRVGVWSTNNVEWVLLQLATARIGAVLVNINPAYRVSELEHALRLARVQILFLIPAFRTSDYVEMSCALCPELKRERGTRLEAQRLPELRDVIVFDPAAPDSTAQPASGFLTWPQMLERGNSVGGTEVEERSQTLDPDDAINVQFTSGTTGFPKAVVLTHHNILNNGFFTARAMRFSAADRLCVPVPFYHCFGMVVANLASLTHGATIIIPAEHFDAAATLETIERERCTAVHGVPTMFVAELECPKFRSFDLSTLRTGIMAGAPCAPELVGRVIDDMGCHDLLIGYGQTEASPITHLTRPDDSRERRVTTVGVNLPHQEVKIVDTDSGALLSVGEPGEVCFRGHHVMREYFGHPDATKQTIDAAGWLHSGDVGIMEDDGYLRITGRLKDMIIRGGENIYPAEIEAFYFEHPKVAEVAVFGVPDARLGEEVGAWIKLHEGAKAEADELREYAKGHIAHFKIPRYIWLVDEFPVTVTGKIQKFRIRETVAKWLEDPSLKPNQPA